MRANRKHKNEQSVTGAGFAISRKQSEKASPWEPLPSFPTFHCHCVIVECPTACRGHCVSVFVSCQMEEQMALYTWMETLWCCQFVSLNSVEAGQLRQFLSSNEQMITTKSWITIQCCNYLLYQLVWDKLKDKTIEIRSHLFLKLQFRVKFPS